MELIILCEDKAILLLNIIIKEPYNGLNESYGEEVFETKDGGYIVKSYRM